GGIMRAAAGATVLLANFNRMPLEMARVKTRLTKPAPHRQIEASNCLAFAISALPLASWIGSDLLALDRKKLPAFSALGGGFLRFPIGDRRCNRTRASVGNAGGGPAPSFQTRPHPQPPLLPPRRSPYPRPLAPDQKKGWPFFGPRQGAPRHSRTFRSTTAAAMPALSKMDLQRAAA